ncbi:hypothetical protein vBPpSSYP_56 [Pseudomonas phage vB_PpS_SYP]|nr:hypothetical protein vBPpSSYP_56 [Pseudomonas phage vB_PpS_SYP]
MTKFDVGIVVQIVAPKSAGVNRTGQQGTIEQYNTTVDGFLCYWVRFENGERGSYSTQWLVPVNELGKQKEPLTLQDVIVAKKAVDDAQKVFVQLLSDYQLQEALK